MVTLCLALIARTFCAGANGNGNTTGRSQTGCGTVSTCHRVNAGATAGIMGPMLVAPGSRTTYTLSINSALAGFIAGGCDVSVTGASLQVNPAQQGTRISGVELVHNAALPRPAGAALTVRFDVVAPGSAGAFTLYAAGNAVDGSRTNVGDAWSVASLRVTVASAPVDAAVPADVTAPTDVMARPDVSMMSDAAAPPDATRPGDAGASEDVPAHTGSELVAFDRARSAAYGRCSARPIEGARGSAWTSASLVIALCVASASRRRIRR